MIPELWLPAMANGLMPAAPRALSDCWQGSVGRFRAVVLAISFSACSAEVGILLALANCSRGFMCQSCTMLFVRYIAVSQVCIFKIRQLASAQTNLPKGLDGAGLKPSTFIWQEQRPSPLQIGTSLVHVHSLSRSILRRALEKMADQSSLLDLT